MPACLDQSDLDENGLPFDFPKPYAIYLGDADDHILAKSAYGLRDWTRDDCIAQIREPGCSVDLGITDLTIADAAAAGARSLVIGIAPAGGNLPDEWRSSLVEALEHGLDIVHGLHEWLSEDDTLVAAARDHHRKIHDVRRPKSRFDVGTGKKRTGYRLLTVGTDCAVGKKYSALALHRGLRARGWNADFRATGQTGIMVTGSGIAIDAVVADFISGAAESLSPDADADHWDVIEGQGALNHPSYAGVALGLLHGSQPDAIVVCHAAGRSTIDGLERYRIPALSEVIDANLQAAALTNPNVRCIAACINTSNMTEEIASSYLDRLSKELLIPCVDPCRGGVEAILDEIERVYFDKQHARSQSES